MNGGWATLNEGVSLERSPVMPSRRLISTLAVVMAASTVPPAALPSEDTARSLYQRIGGYDTIAAVVSDFGRRWEEDPELKPFILGFSSDTGRRQIQMFTEFFCEQSGGPCTYLGRDMKTAHEGLVITEAHWKAFMGILEASLDAAKVPTKEKAEALEIFNRLKPAIRISE
jgi:hemoglobin